MTFGQLMQELEDAANEDRLVPLLEEMGLDVSAAMTGAEYLGRQIAITKGLPDDKTVIIEHFKDQNGSNQVMIHSLFGRTINAPLALLLTQTAKEQYQLNLGCVNEEDGILLYPFGEEVIPEGLLTQIDIITARQVLETILPVTPVFGMTFRYNAARALMMGMKSQGRQPLWMQRIRSTQMLDTVVKHSEHPLVQETKRECLEEIWNIEGVIRLLNSIRAGLITVREIYVEYPSPMSLPLQWQIEAAEVYNYTPVTDGMRQAVYDELRMMEKMKPAAEELAKGIERKKLPENEQQLHSLLMMEGDFISGELDIPFQWLEELVKK